MADALERVTNLLALLLETRAPVTLEHISNELRGQYPENDVALRGAFERDKSTLREIGVPIESTVLAGSDAGKMAYWIDRRRYELADLDLDDDERAALEFAVAAVRLSEGDFGLLKLGGARGRSTVVANVPVVAGLPPLRDATALHAEATFRYHGRERRLRPYALLLREGFWYVIGEEADAGAVRTFRVDRIEGPVEVGEPDAFARPADFDPRQAFPADARLLGDAPVATAQVRLRVPRTVDPHQLGRVVDERADGSVVVEVPCANIDAFRSWLFGWGADAEVLAPESVRDGVIGWLRSMAGRS